MKKDNTSPLLISDFVHFVFMHKKLLNGDLISSNLNQWIDNIFGVGQLPKDKIIRRDCCNIYRKTTYEIKMNLVDKVIAYKKEKKYTPKIIRAKIINKMNFILSFGQTPYQVFTDPHPKKRISDYKDKLQNENNNFEDYDDNELDVFIQFKEKILSNIKCIINLPCVYFEYNSSIHKIFALSKNEEIVETNFDLSDGISKEIASIKTFRIQFLEQKNNEQNIDYYIYKPKYAFSSFDIIEKDEELSKDSDNFYNFNFNIYYKNLFEKMKKGNIYKDNRKEGSYKFIQCRYLDNTFKLFVTTKSDNQKKKNKNKKLIKKTKSYSYLCEDFVASCCTISSNEFLIGLDNGKLIKWSIVKEQKDKIDLIIDKSIQAHKGRINVIEIDKRLGLIITCGNDNLIQIRKLYNLELLTPIQIKKKYIITMAKVSPFNYLYIMCYDKQKNISFIFGYTLTGINFAKSKEGFYCNIDFTKSGNIVSLLNNKEMCILNGYNLNKKEIAEKDCGYNELKEVNDSIKGSTWLEFNYSLQNDYRNYILYTNKGKNTSENMIFYYIFRENSIFD